MLEMKEIEKLEEWTNKKCGEIIFDSDIDNWSQNTSEFDDLILNKRNLLFLIKSDNNIKFGGFLNTIIDKRGDDKWIKDENAFLFTFKDNKPMKFNIKKDKSEYAFIVRTKKQEDLFNFGYYDINIYKKGYKSEIKPNTFEYEGNTNALIGRTGPRCFSPKRIIVIQMK